jgi:hypothetical protein
MSCFLVFIIDSFRAFFRTSRLSREDLHWLRDIHEWYNKALETADKKMWQRVNQEIPRWIEKHGYHPIDFKKVKI